MSKRVFVSLIGVFVFVALLSVRGHGQQGVVQGDDAPVARAAGEAAKLPEGPGKDIVGTACAQCHALQQLYNGHDAG
jgi:cytochrome c5